MVPAFHPIIVLVVLRTALPPVKAAVRFSIARGSTADPNEFPSIVSVQRLSRRSGWHHHCTGVLIGPMTVLTAAHCRIYRNIRKRIVIGAHRLSEADRDARVRKVGLAGQFPHPYFNFATMAHDIMVLRLSEAVEETETIRYDRLPVLEDILPPVLSTDCVIAGWGKVSDTSGTSDVLKKGQVMAQPHMATQSSQIIATPGGLTLDSGCPGDSGGPLYCPTPCVGGSVLVGMLSYGEKRGCGTETGNITFVRVEADLNWIRRHI